MHPGVPGGPGIGGGGGGGGGAQHDGAHRGAQEGAQLNPHGLPGGRKKHVQIIEFHGKLLS